MPLDGSPVKSRHIGPEDTRLNRGFCNEVRLGIFELTGVSVDRGGHSLSTPCGTCGRGYGLRDCKSFLINRFARREPQSLLINPEH